ncbi:MAG: radical SAM protein [Acidobacteria bacterium]|nr:MAG: radical SAM protein [Acidobacteriota bacterium]
MAYELELLKGDLEPRRELRLSSTALGVQQERFQEFFLREYEAEVKALQQQGVLPRSYSAPLGLQFELTHRCNLKCVHCYNDSSGQADVLTLEDWKRIAREAVDLGIYECVISGGEPTIYPGLWEIMDVLRQGQVTLVMITNGLTMTRSLARRIASYEPAWVQVSCDGFDGERHDAIRRHKKSWCQVVKAARFLAEENVPVIFAHSVFRDQLDCVSDLVDLAGCLGCAEVLIGEPLPIGRGAREDVAASLVYSDEDHERLLTTAHAKQSEWADIMVVASPLPPRLSTRIDAIEPNKVMLLRPNGEVRLSCVSPFVVGDLTRESLMQVWSRCRWAYRNEKVRDYGRGIRSSEDLRHSPYGIPHLGEQTRL